MIERVRRFNDPDAPPLCHGRTVRCSIAVVGTFQAWLDAQIAIHQHRLLDAEMMIVIRVVAAISEWPGEFWYVRRGPFPTTPLTGYYEFTIYSPEFATSEDNWQPVFQKAPWR
jgi:hypothetical protein